MDTLDFFRAKAEAYISPMGIMNLRKSSIPFVLVDVRIAPSDKPLETIPDAIHIPMNEIRNRMSELPKDKLIILYCWDTWCSLATNSAIPLLEEGFKVKELYGGVAAWRALGLSFAEPTVACTC